MGASLKIKAFSGKDSKEFQKHYKAVKFCIENELSFPKETSDFFKGGLGGDNLEDYNNDSILEHIENGIAVPLKLTKDNEWYVRIKVADIPSHVDEIIVSVDY
jgi:hypothetical protein